MPDAKWKAFERDVAAMIAGKRYPANSGHDIDCEGPTTVAQCKLVSRLSLEELTRLAENISAQGAALAKTGIVVVKQKRGMGNKSPALVVVTMETWQRFMSQAWANVAAAGAP